MNVTHHLIPYSPEWHAHRASHYNASEAPAMLSLSPHCTRLQLLQQKHSGVTPDVDAATAARFARGHKFERLALPLAEEIIGEELFPVVMSYLWNGLPLSATLDGLTLDATMAWEHKSMNAELCASLADGVIPARYRPQLEQQLLITGAVRLLFMASDGTRENLAHAWYQSNPALREALLKGWEQFAADLATFQPVDTVAKPIAQPIGQLPALLVQIEGRVLSTNLEQFESRALAFIDGINTALESDDDFAQAEAVIKVCAESEKRLELVKSQALAQTASIDEIFRTMDGLRDTLRAKRLALDKLVTTRKNAIRSELVADCNGHLQRHIDKLNERAGAHWIAYPPAAILGEAIKGKKSIGSCRAALNAALANAVIDMDTLAARLVANRARLANGGRDWIAIFPDFATVGGKDAEEFDALVELRVRRFKESEAAQQAAATAPPPITQPSHSDQPQAAPVPVPAPVATALTGPGVAFEVDDIAAFLKSRDFGKEQSRIRGILVEFTKFVDSRAAQRSGQGRAAA